MPRPGLHVPAGVLGSVLALLLMLIPLIPPIPAVAAETGDPDADRQWHLDAVQVPLAWERARGDGVVVAVLDSGITPGPDLACRRFVAEYDAVNRREGRVEDTSGHGTHVAGTIGQCSGNGVRAAGLAPDVTLMDVRVLTGSPGDNGTGTSSDVADGIRHAAEHGADVINLSISTPCPPSAPTHAQGCRFVDIDAAIEFAHALGVTILAPTGNNGTTRVSYPAAHPDVIAVGSVDASLARAPYSNTGSAVDHVAPGGVRDDTDGNGDPDAVYQEWLDPATGDHRLRGLFGTSHAVAHSSGIAALLLDAVPGLSPDQVRTLLNDTACDLGPDGDDNGFGAGLVRAAGALEAAVAGVGRGVCFLDVAPGSTFFVPISRFAQQGLTTGCTSNGNRYCPDLDLTRGEMAAFLNRALDLPLASRDHFRDDEDSIFEQDINRIAEAGITNGCNPPANDRFCPEDSITRGQMAKFLSRGFDPPAATRDYFRDDETSIFEQDINRIREDRITLGCNPPANDRFCPAAPVTRAQMAAFIVRARD